MSDSEDDFMSDKFLVEAPVADTTTTYSSRRKRAEASSAARAKANEVAPLKEREASRRREGLATSLLDAPDADRGQGQAKAMDLMMKMGWKVGEGLGRRRSASPERAEVKPEGSARADRERQRDEDDTPRGGLGSRRAEPIRISMWAGRKGLAARSPSPPPLRRDGTLPPDRLAALGARANTYRGRWGAEANERETERKAEKARQLLIDLDAAAGVKFHPLHVRPGYPDALPKPLFALLYPDEEGSRSPSPLLEAAPPPPPPAAAPTPAAAARANVRHNVNAAEKLREQMRRDMLSELGGDEGSVRFGVPLPDDEGSRPKSGDEGGPVDYADVDWAEHVSGTKRVLAMNPAEQLAFLVSQLRHEHLFCFWCGSKYASWEEMDGFGGCPGEDEDDH